jgi:hypothetical protein
MKWVWAALIILAVAFIVGGAMVGLATLGLSGRGLDGDPPRPPARASEPPAVRGGSAIRVRPEVNGGSPINFGSAASNLFGLRTALGNLAVVGWVTLIGVVGLRWLKSRRGGPGSP